MIQFHDPAAHPGSFLQSNHVFKTYAVLLKSLAFYCICLDLDNTAGIFFFYKVFFFCILRCRFFQDLLYDLPH